MFGKNNDVLVHVLTWEEGLIRLHNELLDALKTLEVELMDPQWTGANWNPHVTDHEGEKFFPGLQATVETAVMIEAEDPVSRPLKKVVARFPLRG
jgi:signal recognition particle subunit SEC65